MVDETPVEPLKLNTKDVFVYLRQFDQSQTVCASGLLQRAQKLGLAYDVTFDKHWGKRRIVNLDTFVATLPGECLPLEKMLSRVRPRQREAVECFYLAGGDQKEALEILRIGTDVPKSGNAPLPVNTRESGLASDAVPKKDSLYKRS